MGSGVAEHLLTDVMSAEPQRFGTYQTVRFTLMMNKKQHNEGCKEPEEDPAAEFIQSVSFSSSMFSRRGTEATSLLLDEPL